MASRVRLSSARNAARDICLAAVRIAAGRSWCQVSTRLHYLWNSANNNPFVGFGIKSMQPGQAFHVNYATSYALFSNVRLGFNGYWLQQLTNHEINGIAVPNSKERTVGLGPGNPVWRPGNLAPRE